jgi:hypothetical protein
MDYNGKLLITPVKYDYLHAISQKVFLAVKGSKKVSRKCK